MTPRATPLTCPSPSRMMAVSLWILKRPHGPHFRRHHHVLQTVRPVHLSLAATHMPMDTTAKTTMRMKMRTCRMPQPPPQCIHIRRCSCPLSTSLTIIRPHITLKTTSPRKSCHQWGPDCTLCSSGRSDKLMIRSTVASFPRSRIVMTTTTSACRTPSLNISANR